MSVTVRSLDFGFVAESHPRDVDFHFVTREKSRFWICHREKSFGAPVRSCCRTSRRVVETTRRDVLQRLLTTRESLMAFVDVGSRAVGAQRRLAIGPVFPGGPLTCVRLRRPSSVELLREPWNTRHSSTAWRLSGTKDLGRAAVHGQ